MLKGWTVKEVSVCFVGKWIHSIAWSMFSQRKTVELMNGSIWMDGILIWMDGIPIYWTEFRSIERNSEGLDGILSKCWYRKKLAWTNLDQVSFEKNFQRVKCRNWKIGVDRSRESQKGASSAASVFKISSRLVTWGSKKRFALQWPDLDKRCGCVFADVQSREELKMLLQAKRQPG